MATHKNKHRLRKEVVATYVVGCMATRGVFNLKALVLSCERGNRRKNMTKNKEQ